MHTSVTFKNLDPSDTLKSYIKDKLDRFDRLLENPAEANVVLSVEKFRHIAEVNIIGDRLSINGKEETDDMYSAIDFVVDKLNKQIKKNKQKVRERRAGGKAKNQVMLNEDMLAAEEDAERELKIKNIEYKPMDVDEAILQLDLLDDNFLVFTNSHSDRVNVLYRRRDGHYGLIQPIP
jgi:putative sigma-54 modulation protein